MQDYDECWSMHLGEGGGGATKTDGKSNQIKLSAFTTIQEEDKKLLKYIKANLK